MVRVSFFIKDLWLALYNLKLPKFYYNSLLHLVKLAGRRRGNLGTGKIPDSKIRKLVENNFDLSPRGIIKKLDLLRPIYEKTATYGHFGRDEKEFTWEKTDMAETLREQVGR